MALPFTNGNIIASSFIAAIGNTNYVVNSASLDYPAETVVVTDANGNPTAARHFKGDLARGEAEIQVNAAADKGDLRGSTFITTEFTNANVNLIITSQSMPIEKNGARVYRIGYAEVL